MAIIHRINNLSYRIEKYHHTWQTIYGCENGDIGKESSQLITVEVLIEHYAEEKALAQWRRQCQEEEATKYMIPNQQNSTIED